MEHSMARQIQDVMTANPVTLSSTSTLAAAAEVMRDAEIGDVFVMQDGRMCGIVTDRDIVVRGLADGNSPDTVSLADICSQELTFVSPKDSVAHGLELMRDRAIRRLPVLDQGQPVGVVSLGDLAEAREAKPTLAGISAAPAND
jgi:CBS domain-containing protein